MNRNMIFKTTLILCCSILAKLISFYTRIFIIRNLDNQTMNAYALATPTLVLVIALAQLGIGNALSRQVAKSQNPLQQLNIALIFAFFHILLLTIIIYFASPHLSQIIYQTKQYTICFLIITLYIPFVCYCSIFRGYLYGIQLHLIASVSTIIEEVIRFIYLWYCFQIHIQQFKRIQDTFFSFIIADILTIIFMIIIVVYKKNKKINYDFKKTEIREFIYLSYNMTFSRLFASLIYFLEPLGMNLFLDTNKQILMSNTYGQIQGSIIPLVTMPSFLTLTLSNILLPYFTYAYYHSNLKQANNYFCLTLCFSLLIGIGCSSICYLFPKQLLNFLYHNHQQSSLLKQITWPYAIYMLQAPLTSVLYSLNLSKQALLDTCIGSILRIITITFLSPYLYEKAILIALTLNIFFTTFTHAFHIFHYFKTNEL